jgi:hypothetical protein
VFADAFGEEKLLRDHAFSQFRCASVRVEFVADFLCTRMSLSHLGGRKQNLPQIFRRFVTENQTPNAPGRFASKKSVWRTHVSFEIRQIEDAIVVRRFLAEFLIDADWQVDLIPPRLRGVWVGGWMSSTGACQYR